MQSGKTQLPLLQTAGADKKHHGSAVFSHKKCFSFYLLSFSLFQTEKGPSDLDRPFSICAPVQLEVFYVSRRSGGGLLCSPHGPLAQRGHRFLCQRKRWERKRRGGAAPSALPPMRNRAKCLLRWDCASLVPFEISFPPMRAVLYCHVRQVTVKTESYRQKIGRPP